MSEKIGESFLSKKYPDLPSSKPVERAVRKRVKQGEKGPQTKEERVDAYLQRIEEIVSMGNRVSNRRGWELLKNKILKEFSIDTEDQDVLAKIAHGLYESEKKLAIEQGRGADVERLERNLESEGGVIERYKGLVKEKRDIQRQNLSNEQKSGWLDYLKKNDAQYPKWFCYFVVRGLQKMGTLDKEKAEYSKRTPHTVVSFPELNSEALGFVYRMMTEGPSKEEFAQDEEKKKKLEKLVAKKDFAKLYAFAQIETQKEVNRESIEGRWIKYDKGSDHHVLENALRGKGTGWCTAEGSAYGHLKGGEFYVFYTKDEKGYYTQPRIAIRVEGDEVTEVRGVGHRQEIEPISELIKEATTKYHSLPGGEKFDKKSADMKKMTRIEKEIKKGSFDSKNKDKRKEDLTFLYEINAPIEGFGYEKDPRIQELLSQRNPKEDAPIALGCQPEEVAWSQGEISDITKAYIGPLFPGVFEKSIDHIYIKFPETPIRKLLSKIGGKTVDQLEQELDEKDEKKNSLFQVSGYARDMLKNPDFIVLENQEDVVLIRLKVRDLGFKYGATTNEIYQRAKEIGLELCPAETGPHLRLQYKEQPLGWFYIGMKQIAGRDGYQYVFELERYEDGLCLAASWARPDSRWNPSSEFVFRLSKLKNLES